MENTPKSGPRDFFLHLFAFGTLYVSAVSLISLWFNYINLKLPDPLQQQYYVSYYGYQQLRWPMAALIVVFPVFLFLTRWISNEIARDAGRKELWIYRWLVYLTLFVSSVTVVVDLVTLIYNFLGGELSARFGLKVVVVLVVALGVFGYYLWHLRSDLAAGSKKRLALLWLTIVIVFASIVAGFFMVGSPAKARAQKFDEQRTMDLQQVQGYVFSYWQTERTLPRDAQGAKSEGDPKTHEPYEYRVISPLSFEVCAVFETNGAADMQKIRPYMYEGSYGIPDSPGFDDWTHGIGRTCFTRTIDPKLFPKPVQ